MSLVRGPELPAQKAGDFDQILLADMAGKGSKVVENQGHLTMQCSAERLTAARTRHFPKHLPEKSLSNCRAKVSFSDLCMHLSHVVFGPQEAFPLTLTDPLCVMDLKVEFLRSDCQTLCKHTQKMTTLYKSLVKTVEFLFWAP